MARKEGPAIGIDLGTTYSCVAVWQHERVEIITNDQGNRTTPSVVAFTPHERLIGEGARNQLSTNAVNTVYDAKRLIGRRFAEENIKNDKSLWPFKVESGDQDKPMVVVQYKNQEKRFSAEEISSMILSKMKEIAEAYIGCPIKKAVVTVPAYFNDSQRQATKDAGTIAGLNVIRVLNEPTAAAMAYGLDNKNNNTHSKKNVLIFDLGGGTFDVSLLEIKRGVLEVKAVAGDTHLGGGDFNNRLVRHLLDVFKRKHNMDISTNPRCIAKLKAESERAKRVLSTTTMTDIEVEALYQGIDFHAKISRAKFEELNIDLFKKCLVPVEKCLKDAKIKKSDIDDIVLVGGSTRIPKVQQLLQEFFNGMAPCNSVNVDEAVAYGAAIQAAKLTGVKSQMVKDVFLLDVTPLSLGTDVRGDKMSVIIPRNTAIPCRKERNYITTHDNQTAMSVKVYEGESSIASRNNLLGKFVLKDLRQAPAGKVKMDVAFDIDEDGILNVSAKERNSENKAAITIAYKGRLSKSEIENMTKEAQKYKSEDEERKKATEAKIELEKYASRIINMINKLIVAGKMDDGMKDKVHTSFKEAIEWSERNEYAQAHEYRYKKSTLEVIWQLVSVTLKLSDLEV